MFLIFRVRFGVDEVIDVCVLLIEIGLELSSIVSLLFIRNLDSVEEVGYGFRMFKSPLLVFRIILR